MGVFDRLGKIGGGLLDAVQAPVGLVWDLARAPWVDEEELDGGLIKVLYGRTVARGAQLFGGALGPESGLAAAAGALPEPVRQPFQTVGGAVGEAAEFAYREGIAEPLTALMTAASLADAGKGFDLRQGYRVAQDRSIGQAFALAFLTEDITDEAEVAKAAGTDAYEIMSGLTDAAVRMVVDPVAVGAKSVKAFRAGRWTPTSKNLDRIMNSNRVATFRDELKNVAGIIDEVDEAGGTARRVVDEGAAARIRDRFFPDMPAGELASVVLADAAAMGDDVLDQALRTLMGSQHDVKALADRSRVLAERVAELRGREDNLRQLGEYAFDVRNGQLDLFGAERTQLMDTLAAIDEITPEQVRVQRELAAAGSLRVAPKASMVDELRTRITHSDVYQESRFTKPLRMAFNMSPHRFVNLHASDSEIQVARMLTRSKLDVAEQEVWRSQYMRAATPAERHKVLVQIEDRTVADMLEKAGVTREQVDQSLREIGQRRGRAIRVLNSRVYDGEGRSRLRFEDDGDVVDMPLLASQTEDLVPLVDLNEVQDAIEWMGSFRQRHGKIDAALEFPAEMMQRFYKIWRPSVLLRVAWPLRVQIDEQLRIAAKIGALAPMKHLRTGIRNVVRNKMDGVPKMDRIPGAGGFEHNGYRVQSAFDQQGVYKALVSARASFGTYFAKDEAYAYNRILKGSGQFRSIRPDEVSYGQAWERAVNRQIRNDPMAKKFLSGSTVDEVVEWLTNTAEGQAHGRKLPFRAGKPRKWAEDVEGQVLSYVPEDLRSAALERALTTDDLVGVVPDASLRPIVHGEILDQALGNSQTQHYLQNVIDAGFEKLGGMTDVLARNPFFDSLYQAEVKRLIDLSPDVRLGLDDLERIQDSARTYALSETKKLLYDLAEESDLAGVLRNFVPFYGAWQEVMTRWAGLAVENPAFVRRMQLVWSAPEKAGIITDENGAVVHGDGTATSVLGEKVKAGESRYINMRLLAESNAVGDLLVNDLIGNIPGIRTLKDAKLSKDSLNTIVQGAPGFGPVVQIPVNAIVKAKPELEETMKFVLPFGASQDWMSMVMPAAAKRLTTRAAGEDDRTYANQMMRIYFDMVVDKNLGKRDEPPTWQEAKKKTDALYSLRFFSSYVSPASITYQSPYQAHIDIYRAMKDQDQAIRDAGGEVEPGKSADDRFYEQFGDEYYELTQSLSRTMDGIPPTVEGAKMRKEHRDLIEAHPELGGLIVGEEGAGEFSRAVYESQLNTPVRPGSGIRQREQFTPEEAARQPNVRRGWTEFSRAMTLIEAERIKRGLPNLKVRAARDLAQMKKGIVEGIGREYPEWYEELMSPDKTKWDRRMAGFRAIVADDKMMGRSEIQGLADYLEARDAVVGELAKRKRAGGSADINAVSNMDVLNMWESIKGGIIEQNLAFESLYHRWLERDPVAQPGPTAVLA